MSKTFKWWYESEKDLALWEKLNKQGKEDTDPRLVDMITEKYGQIYWFKPHEQQLPFLKSNATERYGHGNNSSGKSYGCGAADLAYEVIGWSPYREVKPPKYGQKLCWVFSPNFETQKSSSQIHLFSLDVATDIGLLPSLTTIEKHGGKVRWRTQGVLNEIIMPGGHTKIEFKSEEMAVKNLQASGVDYNWFDEVPVKEDMWDEVTARLIRKDGKLTMTFIIPGDQVANHWLINNIYTPYKNGDKTDCDFFFLTIQNNKALTDTEVERNLARFQGKGKDWRFSEHGGFVATIEGDPVHPNFSKDFHVVEGLLENYDPTRKLFRAWDLGYERPCVVAFQVDEYGRRNYLYSIMGHQEDLTIFIPRVLAFTKEHMPDIGGCQEILPHDANRHYGISPDNSRDIFEKEFKLKCDVLYNKRETSLLACGTALQKTMNGQPVLRFDSEHCEVLVGALQAHTRDEDGQPKRDKYHEHPSDAFRLAEYYYDRRGRSSGVLPPTTPKYSGIAYA